MTRPQCEPAERHYGPLPPRPDHIPRRADTCFRADGRALISLWQLARRGPRPLCRHSAIACATRSNSGPHRDSGRPKRKPLGPVVARRVNVTEQRLGPASEPTLCNLSEALIAVYGTDFGIRTPAWISTFTDMARRAAAYPDKRVLLAGAAAHVHHPVSGGGLNTKFGLSYKETAGQVPVPFARPHPDPRFNRGGGREPHP